MNATIAVPSVAIDTVVQVIPTTRMMWLATSMMLPSHVAARPVPRRGSISSRQV